MAGKGEFDMIIYEFSFLEELITIEDGQDYEEFLVSFESYPGLNKDQVCKSNCKNRKSVHEFRIFRSLG